MLICWIWRHKTIHIKSTCKDVSTRWENYFFRCGQLLKGLIHWKLWKKMFFLNTIGHSELHTHAAFKYFLYPLITWISHRKKNREENERAKILDPSDITVKNSNHGLAHLVLWPPTDGWFCSLERVEHVSALRR